MAQFCCHQPWFCCLHWSPCVGKVIQRIVGQENVQCPAFILKIWAILFRFKRIFGHLVRDPNTARAHVNWSTLDYLPMVHFGMCPTSSEACPRRIVSVEITSFPTKNKRVFVFIRGSLFMYEVFVFVGLRSLLSGSSFLILLANSQTTSKNSFEFTYTNFPCHLKANSDKLVLINRLWKC